MKHPLARAMRAIDLDAASVAGRLGVDPKTVQRWLAGRVPYPRHRAALVNLTGWAARDLWPEVATFPAPSATSDEVRVAYPHRSAVPADAWRHLFERAESAIGVLAYSGPFLAEDAEAQRLLRAKARAGVRVRILLGDRDGRHIGRRDIDEGLGGVMAARIRNSMILYRSLMGEPGIELRLHDTVLYNSIYWADSDILVNMHVHGCPASHAPMLHLHRAQRDGMASTYLDSFERVWATARAAG